MAEDNSPASRDAIRKWMRGIRRTHDIKQEVLGDKLGVSRSTIANWESGVRTVPLSVIDKLIALFPGVKAPVETLNVPTVPDILGKPLFPVGFAPVPMRYAGIVPASTEWGDPLASEELIEVDGKYVNAKRFAALLSGDSCYPALHQGDLTIWESDHNPPYGLIVLAQRKGDHGCTVKELVYDDKANRSRLHPINPDYADPADGDGWGVIARLVVVVRQSDGPEKSWFYPKGLRVRHLVG